MPYIHIMHQSAMSRSITIASCLALSIKVKLPPHVGREDKSKYKITEEQSGNTLLVPFRFVIHWLWGLFCVCWGLGVVRKLNLLAKNSICWHSI